jgi:putative CocE/NonD family hydrolase
MNARRFGPIKARGRRPRRSAVMALLLVILASAVARAQAPDTQATPSPPDQVSAVARGYIHLRDGAELAYGLETPSTAGRHPVALMYAGYSNSENPATDNEGRTLLADGFAILGVNVRGSGCSSGDFTAFEAKWGTDGAQVVEWAARQPWSNGKVVMFGTSFPGITQWMVAAQHPAHLVGIAPDSTISDIYRDVGFPGGIPNTGFARFWYGDQNAEQSLNLATGGIQPRGQVDLLGAQQCSLNFANHTAGNFATNVMSDQMNHPYDDFFVPRSLEGDFAKVQVPVFVESQFNDEQVNGRVSDQFQALPASKTWIIFTNGDHGFPACARCVAMKERFFLWAVGHRNGWERTPHVQLWQDSTKGQSAGWQIDLPSWPRQTATLAYNLRAGNGLSPFAAASPEAPDNYAYPRTAAQVAPNADATGTTDAPGTTYKLPLPPGGSVAYTSPVLRRDVIGLGPASLNLWLASTATDTDLQVTLTEVRADGQEMYVSRGWLRASHRKLDSRLSTATRPYQTHRQKDALPLVPDHATFMRAEIFPYTHAFRAGSRIRVRIEAPVGATGFWNFDYITTQATNTIYHDEAHPSQLVLGILAGRSAGAPLPACDTLDNMPCRTDPGP